jgi:hypothetical protein
MKKLLVLSALLGLLALPVFADHVSIDFGGDHTFGTASDFDAVQGEKIDLTWDVIVGIDDYNSFTWSLAGLGNVIDVGPPIGAISLVALDKALVTTDVGMWLDLPVGIQVMWGYDDPDANEFAVITGFENEQVYDFSPDEYWGLGLILSYMMAEVELAFNPGIADQGDIGYILAGLALKEPIAGLNAEVYWYQGGDLAEAAGPDGILGTGDDDPTLTDETDRGQVGVGAAYATEVAGIGLDVSGSFLYDMDDTATNEWAFGVGAAAAVSMFDITLGVDGNESDALNGLTATVDVSPIDLVTLYAGVEASFASGADEFQGADLGVNAHVGIVEVYVGYNITENAAGEYNSDFELLDGGAYIKFDVDY